MAELGLHNLRTKILRREGALRGPPLMPGSSLETYNHIEDILLKVVPRLLILVTSGDQEILLR